MTLAKRLWINRFRFVSVAAACSLLATSPLAGPNKPATLAIRSAYVTLQNALLKNDAAALFSLLAPQFQNHDVDGSVEDGEAY